MTWCNMSTDIYQAQSTPPYYYHSEAANSELVTVELFYLCSAVSSRSSVIQIKSYKKFVQLYSYVNN